MWCHFQLLRETDAPRSISLSSIKDVLLSHWAFLRDENSTTFIPLKPAGASRVFPLLLVKWVNKGLAWDGESYLGESLQLKDITHFELIILSVGVESLYANYDLSDRA